MFLEDSYEFSVSNSYLDYEFASKGPQGVIKKIVRFTKIIINFNSVGFGDLHERTGEIIDTSVSNNGDDDKVLRTVVNIIFDFTNIYPDSLIVIQGSSASRIRRYQMGIGKYWDKINIQFVVYGYSQEGWEFFIKGKNYQAFMGYRSVQGI